MWYLLIEIVKKSYKGFTIFIKSFLSIFHTVNNEMGQIDFFEGTMVITNLLVSRGFYTSYARRLFISLLRESFARNSQIRHSRKHGRAADDRDFLLLC